MSGVQEALQALMKKAVALAPDSWIPGGKPDPLIHHKHGLIGAAVSRIDGPLKVSGQGAVLRRVSDGEADLRRPQVLDDCARPDCRDRYRCGRSGCRASPW